MGYSNTRNRAGGLRRAAVFGALASLGLICAPGCSSERLNRHINELVLERSRSLGPEAAAPEFTMGEASDYRDEEQARKDPGTVNPEASELEFERADPDRDVASALVGYSESAEREGAMVLTLQEAYRVAQRSSREYKNAEEEFQLAAIRLLIERHRWGPRFFNDVTGSVDTGFDGDSDTTLQLINELRATQRLPYGGQVEARLLVTATQELRRRVSNEYSQSSQLILSGDIPLLRDAGLIAQEELIQRERDLVYSARTFERFRRQFLVDIAQDFFDLVAQQDAIRNQENSLQSRRESMEREIELVEAGRKPAFSAGKLRQDVSRTERTLIDRREVYLLAVDRFKVRLGLPVETAVIIQPEPLDLPEPAATPVEAARMALRYRLDLQNDFDRINDSRRDVANSRNQILPDLDLATSITYDTNSGDDVGRLAFDWDKGDYFASVTFGLPLDREIERLNLRSSVIGLQRQVRTFEQSRDNIVLDARRQRRRIDQERFTLELSEQEVEINRLTVEELKIREANAFDQGQAEDDLLAAENARDAAVRNLRNAVLDYLLATGTLRVDLQGRFEPLPGMGFDPAGGADPAAGAGP